MYYPIDHLQHNDVVSRDQKEVKGNPKVALECS